MKKQARKTTQQQAFDEETKTRALQLLMQVSEPLRGYTLACMNLLASGNLNKDFVRCENGANAIMHEFHKEVSGGLLNAIILNMALGAYRLNVPDQAACYERVFELLQNEPQIFHTIVHTASYAEMLAPACKREAERIQGELEELGRKTEAVLDAHRHDPEPTNRS